jgi:hypothetical protein
LLNNQRGIFKSDTFHMRKSLALQIPYNAAERANGVIAFGFAVGAAVAF